MTMTLLQTLESDFGVIIWCIAWSPNGKFLASAHSDKSIKIWVYEQGKLTL